MNDDEEIIKRLRKLFEEGFLTEEEFNSQVGELDSLDEIPPSETDDIESEKIQSQSPSLKEAELEIELAEAELAKSSCGFCLEYVESWRVETGA